jgi:hypothetical protein
VDSANTLFGEQQSPFKNLATQVTVQNLREKVDHDETCRCSCPSYGRQRHPA